MADLNEELSLAQAEEIFRSAVAASLLRLPGPESIESEIASLSEFFSKLKFQYLEQEARDKFLGLLFFKDIDRVSQRDIDALVEGNAISKATLKLLKKELMALVEASKTTAEEVLVLNRNVEARREETERATAEMRELKEELDGLMNAPGNEGYKMLLDLNKMLESQDMMPEDAIRIAQADLLQDQQTLTELEEKERQLIVDTASHEKIVAELEAKLLQLKNELNHSLPASTHQPDPEQTRAQRLRKLNLLLQKLTVRPVEVRADGGEYVLSYEGKQIVFDKDLRIVRVSKHSISAADVNRINHASAINRYHKFLLWLSRLLQE